MDEGRIIYPTLMVATVEGDTFALWQVETDPKVTQGDFSGTFVVTPEGLMGYEADDDLIEYRHDPQKVLSVLLADKAVLAVGDARQKLPDDFQGTPLTYVDGDATVQAARVSQDEFRQKMAQAQAQSATRKAPEWEEFSLEPIEVEQQRGDSDGDGSADSQQARDTAMAWARGVRELARQWNATENARKTRKYLSYGPDAILPLPVVFER